MLTTWLRKVTRAVVIPIATLLNRLGISANAITIIGCGLNIGVGVLVALGHLRLGGFCLIAAAGIDGIDGTLARLTGKATKFGAFLDSVLDRISESAILLGLAWWYMGQGQRIEEMLAFVAIVGSMLVSYTRARAEGIGVNCEVGFFTRVERSIIIIAALVLGLTSWGLWLLAIGTMATSIQRIVHTYLQIRDTPLESR
jgi:CDP-diacylglycerol---glycerol-3-phosphate 3-phosphatidyltransferase